MENRGRQTEDAEPIDAPRVLIRRSSVSYFQFPVFHCLLFGGFRVGTSSPRTASQRAAARIAVFLPHVVCVALIAATTTLWVRQALGLDPTPRPVADANCDGR